MAAGSSRRSRGASFPVLLHHCVRGKLLYPSIYSKVFLTSPSALSAMRSFSLAISWLSLVHHGVTWANAPPPPPAASSAIHAATDLRRLAEVDKLLKTTPDDAALQMERGQLLWRAGRTNDALNAFRRVSKLVPQSAAAHNNIAVILASQGRFDEARLSLESALKTHDAYATIHENMGQLYAHMAAEAYRKALNADKSEQKSTRAPQLAWVASSDLPPRPDTASLAQAKVPAPPVVMVENPIVSPPPKPEVPPPLRPPAPPPPPPPIPPPATSASRASPAPAPASASPALSPAPAPTAAPSATTSSPSATPSPLPRPAEPTRPPAPTGGADDIQTIARGALTAWAEAWSRQDMRAYAASYRPDFKGSLRNHAEWLEQRRQRIEPRKRIDVEVSDVRAERRGNDIEVSFRQDYTSDGMSVRSRKTVTLERVGDRWLISAETGR